MLFWTGSKTRISAPDPGRPPEAPRDTRKPQKVLGIFGGSARDGLSPRPVEEKAISRLSDHRPEVNGCIVNFNSLTGRGKSRRFLRTP